MYDWRYIYYQIIHKSNIISISGTNYNIHMLFIVVCVSVHMLILFCKLLNQNFKKRILHIEIMHLTPLIGRSSSNSMNMCYHYDFCVHKRLFQKEFHDGFNYFGKLCWHMVLLRGLIFWGCLNICWIVLFTVVR